MTTNRLTFAEDEPGITELVRRLTDDSRRLVSDEVRLAKLEVRDGVRSGARGAMWLALAFGAAVVALTALTVLLSALLGRLFGNVWAGTLAAGVLELLAGALLLRHGLALYREPSYTLEETRASVAATARWAKNPRGE
jgi:hypothetical protein